MLKASRSTRTRSRFTRVYWFSDHPETAHTLSGLASLYYMQGKYEQAEPLYQRALSICEQVPGASRVEVANILNALALL